MNFLLAAADHDPMSHVVPHDLTSPIFSMKVGDESMNIPALFIENGKYEFSITNHLMMSAVAAVLVILVFAYVASRVRSKGDSLESFQTKGKFSQLFETLCWFIRDEVARPNLGHLTDKYIYYIWTIFFFILFGNVLGLIPFGYFMQMVSSPFAKGDEHLAWSHWGGAATGNLSLNVVMAICSFIAVVYIGIKETGAKAFFSHFNPLGWDGPKAISYGMGIPLYFLEWMGLIIKCVVLAMRLFGTMMAGHLVIAVFVGFVFMAAGVSQALGYGVGVAVIGVGILLTLLELFICFLQAFIFTFLTVLFISMTATHHGDHDHDPHHDPLSDEVQMDMDKLVEPERMGPMATT